MKGGYQILDLTGATAGSPVEVKGIYKAAAGNNGKPVLILTNDGQRVYAEIAEDDGDYITCYISAEGKTVNITIEPDDSVTTVISDPGASITGLEQAVNELDNKLSGDSVSIVADGVKTFEELFNSLYSTLDKSKITVSSYLIMGTNCYNVSGMSSSNISFTRVNIDGNLDVNTSRVFLSSSNSAFYNATGSLKAADQSAIVAANGAEIVLVYSAGIK